MGAINFGTYQLVLSFITITGSINILHYNHLTNHLMKHPEDEDIVIGSWHWQCIVLWVGTVVSLLVALLVSESKEIIIFFLYASFRLFFKLTESFSIVSSVKLRNDLVQKTEIVGNALFNFSRILMSYFKASLITMVLGIPLLGVFLACSQLGLKKKLNLNFSMKFDWSRFKNLFLSGLSLTLLGIVSTFQAKLFSTVINVKMNPQDYGNFQLILKLLEPMQLIPTIILGANYTVLTYTYLNLHRDFIPRFFKLGLVCILVSFVSALFAFYAPAQLLIDLLGKSYKEAASSMWLGGGMIISNCIFLLVQNYDIVVTKYKRAFLVNLFSLVTYIICFFLLPSANMIQNSFYVLTLVPFLWTLPYIYWIGVDFKKNKNSSSIYTKLKS